MQARRTFLALAVAMAVFFLWMNVISYLPMWRSYFHPPAPMEAAPEKPNPAEESPATQPEASTQPTTWPATQRGGESIVTSAPEKSPPKKAPITAVPASMPEPRAVVLGSLDLAKSDQPHYRMQVALTSQGAGVVRAELADYYHAPKGAEEDTQDAGKVTPKLAKKLADYFKAPDHRNHYAILHGDPDRPTTQMAVESFEVNGEKVGRLRLDKWEGDLSGLVWQAGERESFTDDRGPGEKVQFVAHLHRGAEPVLDIIKTFTLRKDSYDLGVQYAFANTGGAPGAPGAAVNDLKVTVEDSGVTTLDQEAVRDDRELVWCPNKGDLTRAGREVILKEPDKGKMSETGDKDGDLLWAAVDNRFFAMVLRPALTEEQKKAVKVQFALKRLGNTPNDSLQLHWTCKDLAVPADGSPATLDFSNFIGPKDRDLLTNTDKHREYLVLRYDRLINYGGSCCVGNSDCCNQIFLTPWLAPFMVGMLKVIHKAIPNYGWAIMILVAIVRVLLHPLTKKSQVSMSRMSKLQPKVEELKKKYADDKGEQQKAMQELYRQEGFNPLLGCLPMLLQMPIWVALWAGLNTSIELRHASFISWINDLATPDALRTWTTPAEGYNIPLVGGIMGPVFSLNVLPVLLMIAMFFQQLLTPKPAGQQAGQQKFMMYFMTVFFGLMFYNMPSGLTLYVMASTAVGAAEQYVIKKHIKQQDEAKTGGAAQATVKERPLPASFRQKRRRR